MASRPKRRSPGLSYHAHSNVEAIAYSEHYRSLGVRLGRLEVKLIHEGRVHSRTPDVRYFVVKGQLWRCSNPALSAKERQRMVHGLMNARRAVKEAKAAVDPDLL